MTLPSKKIAPTIVACLIAIGGIAFATLYNPKSSSTTPQISGSLSTVSPVGDDLDQDNNVGSLLSEGTGTPSVSVAAALAGASGSATSTLTDQIAQNLMSQYMLAKQNGGTLDADTQNQIVQNTILNSSAVPLDATVYTQKNIRISSDTSAAALKNYGNAIGTAISKNAVPITDNELLVLEQALDNNDQSQMANIATDISAYKKMLAGFLSTEVPESAVGLQINLVNSFSEVIVADGQLYNVFKDPVTTLSGLQNYEQASADVIDSFQALGKYLESNGVTFQQSDPGYYLTQNS